MYLPVQDYSRMYATSGYAAHLQSEQRVMNVGSQNAQEPELEPNLGSKAIGKFFAFFYKKSEKINGHVT